MVKYIRTGAGSEEATKEGKKIMIWGIVGLFIAFSIWGIITFIQSELGIPNVENPEIPFINATNSGLVTDPNSPNHINNIFNNN